MGFSIKKTVNRVAEAAKDTIASKPYQATLGMTFNVPSARVINTVGAEAGKLASSAVRSTSALVSNAQAIQPQVAQLAQNVNALSALAQNPLAPPSAQSGGGFVGYAPPPESGGLNTNTLLIVIVAAVGLFAIVLLRK